MSSTTEYAPHADVRNMTRAQLIHVVEQHRQRIASLVDLLDEANATKDRPAPVVEAKWGVCEDCGRKREAADRAVRRRREKRNARQREIAAQKKEETKE